MSLLGRPHQGGHQTKAGAVRLPRDCLLWEHDWGGHDQMSPPMCSADRGRSKSKKKQMQPREASFSLQWLPSALYWQSSTSRSGGETQKSLVQQVLKVNGPRRGNTQEEAHFLKNFLGPLLSYYFFFAAF